MHARMVQKKHVYRNMLACNGSLSPSDTTAKGLTMIEIDSNPEKHILSMIAHLIKRQEIMFMNHGNCTV